MISVCMEFYKSLRTDSNRDLHPNQREEQAVTVQEVEDLESLSIDQVGRVAIAYQWPPKRLFS